MQLGSLRFLGFCPDELCGAPERILTYVGEQLDVNPAVLANYGRRAGTRTTHLRQIRRHLGFRRATAAILQEMESWLAERALEHSGPALLLELLCDRLLAAKVVRPGLTLLERVVSSARNEARRETYRRLAPWLTVERRAALDALVQVDGSLGRTPLVWIRHDPRRNSPRSISETLEKLWFIEQRTAGVDLSMLTPNHRKVLAQTATKSSSQAIAVMPEERRYPVLLAFMQRAKEEMIDDAIDMFVRCMTDTYARAGRELNERRLKVAGATEEKVRMFHELVGLVVDRDIPDEELRSTIFDRMTEEILLAALEDCKELVRPEDGGRVDLFADRYAYLRQFAPAFLAAFEFRSNPAARSLLDAIEILRELNATGQRTVPETAPLEFVPDNWKPYVLVDEEGRFNRRCYELCVLWQLRAALRSGDVWVVGSRRYASLESYLIPKGQWEGLRADICAQVGATPDVHQRLAAKRAELEQLLQHVDDRMPHYEKVRMEKGDVVVPRYEAHDRSPSLVELEQLVDSRLPVVHLTDALLEVDGWTDYSGELRHAGGGEPRSKDLIVNCHASILAQACDLGLTRMAQVAELSYESLVWTTTWYLREETLQKAYTRIVNFQHRQPLASKWGTGRFWSSDGRRVASAVRSRTTTAVPRYFGYGRGLTFATWASDQYSQPRAKPMPTTMRDATYVLDGILENETELSPAEHTTDTAGYTDIVFALFDLLGIQFLPRLADPGSRTLYRFDKKVRYRNIESLIDGTLRPAMIVKQWDEMLRLTGSLKRGWVSSSLFLAKLQARSPKNALAQALAEYGRLVRTIFLLRYIDDETLQRRIGAQINKGETVNGLHKFLLIANEGQLRRADDEEQINQVSCLALVANAVIAWNTVYIQAVLDQLRAEGHVVKDDDVAHLSPVRYAHINPYGVFHFDVARRARAHPHRLRPLRKP
jgi:TnpA family transposase